ncbi:E3 ubiquitin ligase family protein [Sandaracinus amylolyticus]|uniref:E3 ubiquitin ligase family protein n=1 Tax=Sandaracinus amylolyticus TaxID=927083 RepID=UPI001F17ACB6|nr:E3 ubiquitin ligase family protein [Sandaracinus amylolyticus]UJR86322.1 Hypothetical protein I5071_84060 [Sandaracinus amylolyticus]
MISPLILFAALGAVGAAALGAWWFSPYQQTLRAIRAAPLVRVADAPDGQLVRILGTLRAGTRTLDAPLSQLTCAAYRVEVDVRVSTGKSSSWRSLIRDRESVDFVVEDETGRAIVKALQLEPAIVLDHHQRSGTWNDATPELDAYLTRHGHKSTDFFGFNKGMRYQEGVLEPGETVAILGLARWEDDPHPGAARGGAGYRETARRKRLVIEPSALGPVRASDDPSVLS